MTGPSPAIRPAAIADLPRLVAAADSVFRAEPLRPGLGSMGRDYPLLFDPGNVQNLVIVEVDGVVVGHAGFTLQTAVAGGRTFRAACFGSVFTLPAAEGHGLASRALAEAIRRARAAGADLGMVSGARGLYERAGFAPYPLCRRFRAGGGASPPDDTRALPFEPAALSAVMALQAAEPVRFVRSRADWERLLAARVIFYDPATVFTIERGGQTVAYVVVGRRSDTVSEVPSFRVLELGGDRPAIAAAVPSLARQLGSDAVDIVAPPHDLTLDAEAAARGWAAEDSQFPFTAAWWTPALAGLPLPWYGLNYV